MQRRTGTPKTTRRTCLKLIDVPLKLMLSRYSTATGAILSPRQFPFSSTSWGRRTVDMRRAAYAQDLCGHGAVRLIRHGTHESSMNRERLSIHCRPWTCAGNYRACRLAGDPRHLRRRRQRTIARRPTRKPRSLPAPASPTRKAEGPGLARVYYDRGTGYLNFGRHKEVGRRFSTARSSFAGTTAYAILTAV